MKKIFQFGETMPGSDLKVFNEREARSATGILFTLAIVSFLTAFFTENYIPIKAFITLFMVDFAIRLIINPRYSPTMILGRLATKNQKVEYTGAPQKRFAWALGFALAVFMFFWLVIFDNKGLVNLSTCILCLTLLFFETAFGICIGCKMYNMFTKKKAKMCPGGVCELKRKEEIQKISTSQIIVLTMFLIGITLAIINLF